MIQKSTDCLLGWGLKTVKCEKIQQNVFLTIPLALRMLLTTRRNYPIAMQRPSWKNRGKNFSDLGIQIDCGKADLTTVKNVLHFVTSGTTKFMFNVGKELYFVPIVMLMKCLTQVNYYSIGLLCVLAFWAQ